MKSWLNCIKIMIKARVLEYFCNFKTKHTEEKGMYL